MKYGIPETVCEIVTGLFDDVFMLEFFSEVFNTTTINTEI